MPDTTNDLLQELEQYQMIFAHMPIMLWYKDTHNRHLRVNAAAAALEGVRPEDIEGKTAEELYPPEQAAIFYADDQQVIGSGQPKLGILEKHVTPLGHTMYLHTGKVPVRDKDGKITGVIAFAVDVTKQQEAEAALKAAHEALEHHHRQQERLYEFGRSTIEQLTNAVHHGADRTEILRLLKAAQEEYDALDK